jgi:acyl-coenzyme A synthetase/AMP-(fatty) acid ligase
VRYVVLADLPRTSGGKVARAALRDQLTGAGRRDLPP